MSSLSTRLSVVLGIAAASQAMASTAGCEAAYSLVADQRYEHAFSGLDNCLLASNLAAVDKARYLQGRAWAVYSVGRIAEAIQDQDSSFALTAFDPR